MEKASCFYDKQEALILLLQLFLESSQFCER